MIHVCFMWGAFTATEWFPWAFACWGEGIRWLDHPNCSWTNPTLIVNLGPWPYKLWSTKCPTEMWGGHGTLTGISGFERTSLRVSWAGQGHQGFWPLTQMRRAYLGSKRSPEKRPGLSDVYSMLELTQQFQKCGGLINSITTKQQTNW